VTKYLQSIWVALASVGLAYGLACLLWINHFVWTLLKGRYYLYSLLFLGSLTVWCAIYLCIWSKMRATPLRTSLVGMAGGYLSSLCAFLLLPIYRDNSARRIFTTHDLHDSAMFLSPLIATGWLVGLFAALAMWILWEKIAPLR
jgi:hypothetical protein